VTVDAAGSRQTVTQRATIVGPTVTSTATVVKTAIPESKTKVETETVTITKTKAVGISLLLVLIGALIALALVRAAYTYGWIRGDDGNRKFIKEVTDDLRYDK
jgi:hypothetical protein